MRMILKYIFTNVKERKTRTAVMLLSILLSATLLFVSFSIGVSYESAQRKMARGMAGSAALEVTAVNRMADGIIDGKLVPGLSSVMAEVGILEGSALYHEKGYYETIDLIAVDLDELEQINPLRLADGGEIRDLSGNQVILPDRFTSKYGIQKGDFISFQAGGSPVRLEVAGIAAYDTVFLRHTRGATALLPLPALAGILGVKDGYSKVLLKPGEGVSVEQVKAEVEAALPAGEYRVSEVVDEAQIAAEARQKSMPFFLISFFSLTMSVFIIYSSYKVITLDRIPVIGTFRSIGATQSAVTVILLLESILYGGIGGLAGIPVGMLALKLILRGMGQSLSQGIEIPVVVMPVSILASVAVAVLVSLLSAWLPVHRASRLPVKDVVLGRIEEKRVPRHFVVVVGVVLSAVSVILPEMASGRLLYLAGGISLLGLIAAAILVIPVMTDWCSVVLEHFYGAVLGNEGRLAARNMRGNKSASQNITLLFISISAVIAITVVGNFVTAYISDVFRGAELDGFADGRMEEAFVETVREMDGVEKVLPLYVYDGMEADGVPLARVEATGNLDWYSSMMALDFTGRDGKEQALSAFSSGRAILLSENCLERMGSAVGDILLLSSGGDAPPIPLGGGQSGYLVAGSFKSRATDVDAVIPSAYAVSDFGSRDYGFLAYTAQDPEAVMVQIRNLFGETPNWSRTVEEFNQDALSTVGAFLQPMHTMTWFILLLAAVGVVNNLLIHDIQRRRSIAMYKAVGLSNRQSMKMVLVEAFSVSLTGAVIAICVSYMEIRTIFLVAGPKISMTPKLDAATFLTAGVMGIAVTLFGSAMPIIRRRRMQLIEEIRFE